MEGFLLKYKAPGTFNDDENAFWLKKRKKLFNTYDVNKDGVITEDDFMLTADRCIKAYGWDPNDAKAVSYRKIALDIYEKQMAGGRQATTYEEFVDQCVKARADISNFVKHFLQYGNALFDIIDSNGDGKISQEKHRIYFEALGLTASASASTFAMLDTNHDGILSKEEFAAGLMEFSNGVDPTNPATNFWGPLDENM